MELEFFGGNCFRIKTKNTIIVVDDNLNKLGLKSIQNDKSVGFYTSDLVYDESSAQNSRLVIRTAGEFEVGDVTVYGVQARSHVDEYDGRSAQVFQSMHASQTITVLGHIHPDISDEVTELISGTDVLVIPMGGNGYTLDPIGAVSIIKKAEPSIVVPSHYNLTGVKYEVPAQPIEEFSKAMAINIEDELSSLKISKTAEESGGQTKVVVLKRL